MQQKKVCWFLSHVCNGKFAVFWALGCGITYKWRLFLRILIHIYIIDLLTRAHLKFAIDLRCLCLTSETASLSPGLFACHRVVLFECVATNRSKTKTTGIENTYSTLTATSFPVRVNNSLKISAITNI